MQKNTFYMCTIYLYSFAKKFLILNCQYNIAKSCMKRCSA